MDEQRFPDFERALRSRVRGDVACDATSRGLYATDASMYQVTPVAVCVPLDEDDVRAAVAVAAEFGVPIIARGGGTSLAGQVIGAALVLDVSKHLNGLLEVNVAERWARVQPGLVRDVLNAALAPHGLHLSPDPATANRATVGGMIANNSSGTRSIRYGKTIDHVLEARVLTSDGVEMTLGELSATEYDARASGDGRDAAIHRGVRAIVEREADEIRARYPKIMRRVQGYSLDELVDAERWNLAKLFCGSEGTLATLLEAKIHLDPLPKATVLCCPHFDDVLDSVRAVEAILAHGPSAVEILDRHVLQLARGNRSLAPLCGWIDGDPAAVLMVEISGDDAAELRERAAALVDDLAGRGMGYAAPVLVDALDKAQVWEVRKAGLGLLLGMRGDAKPQAFIEDAAVPIAVLPDYIDQVMGLCRALETDLVIYAHASVGLLHVRPVLNLKSRDDIERMKQIAEGAFELVVKYGGSWSGEHGDGRVRSPFLERYFGPRLYGAFREIKALFDPQGLMNPGIIVDAPPMDEDLRYGPDYPTAQPPSWYRYPAEGDLQHAVEMCNGVGACRKWLGGTMCPSYRATLDEAHCTRGRANALRLAITGQLGPDGMTSQGVFDVLDLCLSCKGCKSECPSNVDVARFKSEFLQNWHDHHGLTLRDRMIGSSPDMAARLAGPLAPLANAVMAQPLTRKLLARVAGLHAERVAPGYAREPFARWWAGRGPQRRSERKVVLFADTYVSYHEPSVGQAAVELLESCGYEVIVAHPGCCQRPRISHGLLREAARRGEKTMRGLDEYIRQGYDIVVCEPSCCSALTDDLPDLVADAELGRRVAEHTLLVDQFLFREISEGRLEIEFEALFPKLLVHGHCHQKSLYGTKSMMGILNRAAGTSAREVDSGCCGMAGSFGYEAEHYDLSQQIGEHALFPAVRAAEGETVVACGFSCRHQIKDGTGVRAVHWVETVRGRQPGR